MELEQSQPGCFASAVLKCDDCNECGLDLVGGVMPGLKRRHSMSRSSESSIANARREPSRTLRHRRFTLGGCWTVRSDGLRGGPAHERDSHGIGSRRVNVFQMVLREPSQRVIFELLIGIPLAVGAGRLLASELYGISQWDPLALAVAVVTLGICALIAAIIPARRAAPMSPLDALRTG